MPVAAFPLPLVGRSAELALLGDALARAAAGSGSTLLLAGEGGVGKTRLAQAALDDAARRGFVAALGRAYAVETGIPYAPWADALLPLLRGLEPGALAVLTRGGEADLAQLFPSLADAAAHRGAGVAAPAAPAAPASSEQKAQLHWRLAQLLSRLAARRPLLVVLENLQWADASSLELLHFVARQLGAARVLLVGTYNEAERDLAPLLRTAEQSLASLGAARTVHVAPLRPDDTATLARAALGAAASPELADRLHDRTRGNAFFLEETLKALVDAVGGTADATAVAALADAALPRSVRDAALARLDRLGAVAREVAELAAVLGARTPYPVLRALVPRPEGELVAALEELGRRAVLVDAGDGAGGAGAEGDGADGDAYDFAHPILRDVLYEGLGRPRARLLHAAVAGTLERHYGRAADAHADELAFHFARAGGGEAPGKAARYLVLAGRAAVGRYANREAAGYLQRALDLAEAGTDAGEADVAELVPLLARVRQRLGEYDAAAALWARARDAAAQRADAAAVAHAERHLGLGCYWSGRHDEALAHYDAGLCTAADAGDEPTLVRLRLARGNCLQALGRHAEARDEALAALAIAERLGDAALLARVHRALLLLYAWTGPTGPARAHGAEVVRLAAAAGDRPVEWSAHWALAMLEGLTGHAAAIEHHLTESDRIADELHSPLLRLWSAEVAIEYLSGVGRWQEALALADRTIPAARALGQRTLLPRLLVWTGLVWRGIGDLPRARALIDEAWTLSGAGDADATARDLSGVVVAHTGLAGCHVTAGEWRQALDVGERGLAIAERAGYVVWSVYRLLPFVIESALWLGDFERAALHVARLRRDSAQLEHGLGLAWADTSDALIAFLTGPRDAAAGMLQDAVARLEAVPYVFDAARVRRMTAQALVAAGDREGAVRELRLAHDAFARIGAERELAGTRDRLRELGARPPVKAVSAGTAGMTGRELEIARLVARRCSNKEIATTLDVSPRTVSTHLSNIFTKLGVGSRGELADLVREEGLLE